MICKTCEADCITVNETYDTCIHCRQKALHEEVERKKERFNDDNGE